MNNSTVIVVREKGYDPDKKMKRFLARHLGEGKFVNTATGEIFTLGDNLEIEDATLRPHA